MTSDCGDDCNQVLVDMMLYLDGELEVSASEHLTAHLGDCSPCKDRVHFEACLRDVLRTRCVDQAPSELVARIEAKLSQWSA